MKPSPEKSRKIFVDTNVWIGYLAECEPHASAFFMKAGDCRFTILVNDYVIKELIQNDAFDQEVFLELERRGKVVVRSLRQDVRELAQSLPTHWPDSLHAATALIERVPVLTWNVRDFEVGGLEVLKPDEID